MSFSTFTYFFAHTTINSFLFGLMVWIVYQFLRYVVCKYVSNPAICIVVMAYVSILAIATAWGIDLFYTFQQAPLVALTSTTSLGKVMNGTEEIYRTMNTLIFLVYVGLFVYNGRTIVREALLMKFILTLPHVSMSPYLSNLVLKEQAKGMRLWQMPVFRFVAERVGPLTVSLLHPIIIYPATLFSQLPPQAVASLAMHEMVHVKFLDFYFHTLMQLVKWILSFNPWVAFLVKDIQIWQEINCDSHVLKRCDKTIYFEALLQLATHRRSGLAKNAQSVLLKRVEYAYQNKLPFSFNVNQLLSRTAYVFIALALYALPFLSTTQFSHNVKDEALDARYALSVAPVALHEHLLINVAYTHFTLPSLPFSDLPSPKVFAFSSKKALEHILWTEMPKLERTPVLVAKYNSVVATLNYTHPYVVIPIRNVQTTAQREEDLKIFIYESLVWLIAHNDVFQESSFPGFTPEEFAAVVEMHHENKELVEAEVKRIVNELNDKEQLEAMAEGVQEKVLNILYNRIGEEGRADSSTIL